MAYNVFISFRYSDGHELKDELSNYFTSYADTVDFSEDKDRSYLSESSIQNYLYSKLRRSSITIVLLTPMAITHKKNWARQYDDWMYDEIRYSLEDRQNNRTNGLIAVYSSDAEDLLVERSNDGLTYVKDVDNLFRKNMMNIKTAYKHNPNYNQYDSDYDSYCSLIPYSRFTNNLGKYIDIAIEKRNNLYQYNICKRL